MEVSDSEWTGFHITGGNNGGLGGAMWVGTNGKLSYCAIYGNNSGNSGGAISSNGGIFENCEIHHNTATYSGGGILGENIQIINCYIHHNTAGAESGGGVVLKGVNSVIDNSIVSDNIASITGNGKAGGIMIQELALVKNSIISNNIASTAGNGEGGGIFDQGGIIDNCIIENNTATTFGGASGQGGGVMMNNTNDAKIYNSIIRGNKATADLASATVGNGGGLAMYGSNEAINCLIINNEANERGGVSMGDSPKIINCTVANNRSNTNGGIFIANGAIKNSIVWGNSTALGDPEIVNYWSATVSHSIYSGAENNGTYLIGNLDINPQFVDAVNSDYRVKATSLAIDAGDDDLYLVTYPATDFAGKTRNAGSAIDIGAYELTDFIIGASVPKTSADYINGHYEDIIFQSDETNTAQLTGISAGGLTVNGVVKYVKTFLTKPVWYPTGFPFAMAEYWGDFTVDPQLYIYDEDESWGDFWVKSYTGSAFAYSKTIEANTGYIVQFPSPFIGKEVTFISADAPTLNNVAAFGSPLTSGTYTLVANPSVANLTLDAGDATYHYYIYNRSLNNFALLTAGTATIKPFESFVAVTGVLEGNLRSSLGVDEVTGLENIISNQGNDPVIGAHYYTLQGKEVQQPVNNGIYLVKNIHASGKTETTKTIYNQLRRK
jgi:hypothetical protein